MNLNDREQWILWMNQARRQPSWTTKIALACAVVVIVLPLLALALAALVVGVVVFLILGGVIAGMNVIRNMFAGLSNLNAMPSQTDVSDGRQNVRILRR